MELVFVQGGRMNPYLDMHCDTLLAGLAAPEKSILQLPDSSVDLKRLANAGVMCQFAAVFFPPRDDPRFRLIGDDVRFFEAARGIFEEAWTRHGELCAPAYSAADIERNFAAGKVSLMLTVEDGRAVEGSFERLRRFYETGVRAMALTWNFANCFGSPNSRDPQVMEQGLTDFGREAVPVMNEMGMLIDVSHLSDGGFRDVAELSRKPFVATHSNCRALSPHPRNLTDEMMRTLANKGGVMGLNFCPAFLNEDESRDRSRVSRMAAHVRHVIDVGGEDLPALGTDFDGISGTLEISEPGQMDLLWQALAAEKISPRVIDKIASGNAMRVLRDVL